MQKKRYYEAKVALIIRLKMLKGISNERKSPIFYSDNYFSVLPGELKTGHFGVGCQDYWW